MGAIFLWIACGDDLGPMNGDTSAGPLTAASGITTAPTTAGVTHGSTTSTSGGSGDTSATTPAEGQPTDAVKYDVGVDSGGVEHETEGKAEGCGKIDFLFVVDNSGSMEEEQQALVSSFDGFIASIQNTVMAEDYHIMVIDTDDGTLWLEDCWALCALLPECGGYTCDMLPAPDSCEIVLGSGLRKDPLNQDCGITGGHRYMVDGQPNLGDTFECVAKVGIDGNGGERPMEAMVAAVSTLNGPGKCNEGFLRKDALLVVTFITDEDDDDVANGESHGNPAGWHAALVAAKYGSEKSIVVLGLIGDPDQPNAVCVQEAEPSPRLRAFAESFTFGSWGSVCSSDYAPFFDAAVSVIDTACDQFEPPG
ncbi:hypothetical protein [Nannocystis radixulma]|uniref:VWFA domain-containing protein n=1 Tax=Nannocystis radixulma TaxID=2995305 RepID=A0ABT5BGQ4_9BACT|nr:hypothetical protein [Nannocystis radixulma]MDC0672608.1 hypothetical protein [Nannocystis radixulma]